MTQRLAVFRFYASSWRGAGHAMRCMTLARALQDKGWRCQFVTEEESYDFVSELAAFERIHPDLFFSQPHRHDLLVVDHYNCDYEYEHRFRPFNKTIMVIDDLADRHHDCDIILDQTYGRTKNEYECSVPSDCIILTGSQYALLRTEFSALRETALAKRKKISSINRVLVNFGSNDQKNMTLETLKALQDIHYCGFVDVAFGVVAPHREVVESYAATMTGKVNFYLNPDMSVLMLQADLAVGAAGSTTWERCALGLPSILLETADNQQTIIHNLCRDEVVIGAGLSSLSCEGLIRNFNHSKYQDFVKRTADICDGLGVYHALSAIGLTKLAAVS